MKAGAVKCPACGSGLRDLDAEQELTPRIDDLVGATRVTFGACQQGHSLAVSTSACPSWANSVAWDKVKSSVLLMEPAKVGH